LFGGGAEFEGGAGGGAVEFDEDAADVVAILNAAFQNQLAQ